MRHSIHRTRQLARAFQLAFRQNLLVPRPGALAAAVLSSAVLLLGSPEAYGETSRYDSAHVDYEIGHYQRAFAVFASLADEGHCGAARLAQQMVRYSRQIYAADFNVSPERLGRWQRLPKCEVAPAPAVLERSTER